MCSDVNYSPKTLQDILLNKPQGQILHETYFSRFSLQLCIEIQ